MDEEDDEDVDFDMMPCSMFDFDMEPVLKLQIATEKIDSDTDQCDPKIETVKPCDLRQEQLKSAFADCQNPEPKNDQAECDFLAKGDWTTETHASACITEAANVKRVQDNENNQPCKTNSIKFKTPVSSDNIQAENKTTPLTIQIAEPACETYKKRSSIIKQMPGALGSRPMMLQKRLKAAFAKIKERGDPWKEFHIDELPGQLATRYRYNAKKKLWVEDQIIVKMEPEAFAHGAMRGCHRMKKLSTIHSQDWKEAANYVAKKYIDRVADDVYFEDVKLQMDAKIWAEMYNRMGPPKQIDIFQMCVIKMEEGGQLFHVEHFIEGEYIKYNSNSGFVDEHMRHTPHAFSHFTFEHSGHKLIVVDIQGVGDLYTDPQIHTSEGTDYGDGNLGTKGMALFFHSHLCNPICKLLNLSKFDLSEAEFNEIKTGSSKAMSPATTVVNPNRRSRCSASASSLSPHSEHTERQFSFDGSGSGSGMVFNIAQSPTNESPSRNGSIGSMPQSPSEGEEMVMSRRIRHEDSMSLEIGSPLDEHFESTMRNHKPSTVNGIEDVSKIVESLVTDSVLGQIHFELAKYHELGRFANEGEIDADSALYHLDIAAQLENDEAIRCLAQIYLQRENDVIPSVTVPETDGNTNKGVDFMIQSAHKGDRVAQVYMAKAFETGFGLGTRKSKNWKDAAVFYDMAINSSSGGCEGMDEPSYKLMASLANLYHKGGFGLEKDPSASGDLYNEAAETAMAQFKGALATKYFELAEVAWSEMEEE